MRSPRLRLALAVALVALAGGFARGSRHASASAHDATKPPTGVGPIDLVPPSDATFAHDEAELRTMLKAGPSEIWLEAKTYRGDFEITRPLRLFGRRGAALEGTHDATVLRIAADDVTVENLVVTGSGHKYTTEDGGVHATGKGIAIRHMFVDGTLFGISLDRCTHCTLEDSHVRGADIAVGLRGDGIKAYEAHDSVLRRNWVERARDMVVWYTRRARCEENLVEGSRYGTHFMYAHDAVVRRNRYVGNVVGVFVMYSARLDVEENVMAGAHGAAGMGIGFKESDAVVVKDNALVGNTEGVYLDRTPRSENDPVRFSGNRIAVNDLALRVHGTFSGITFSGNDFASNGGLVEVDGGGNALKMTFTGNHWSEYDGYDLDRDGVGDVPFTFKRLSSELSQEHPALRLLHGTVAMGMVDAIAHAFPVLSQEPVLIDPRPAMHASQTSSKGTP